MIDLIKFLGPCTDLLIEPFLRDMQADSQVLTKTYFLDYEGEEGQIMFEGPTYKHAVGYDALSPSACPSLP